MKKRVSLYLVLILSASAFSLQSCVTNYVVSQPMSYQSKTVQLRELSEKKLNEAKKEISNSNKIDLALANFEDISKNRDIKQTLMHSLFLDRIIEEAKTYLGTPYRYGGMTRKGIDCSAFVLSVFGAAAGVSLPRVASAQAKEGERITKDSLEKGDLLFFSHGRRIAHVGIVEDITPEGEIKFIHAATSKGVMISTLDNSYWAPKFRFAKRIVPEDVTELTTVMNKEDETLQTQAKNN